jgi:hypothetical protein
VFLFSHFSSSGSKWQFYSGVEWHIGRQYGPKNYRYSGYFRLGNFLLGTQNGMDRGSEFECELRIRVRGTSHTNRYSKNLNDGRASYRACILCVHLIDLYLIGLHLINLHLIGLHFIGLHLIGRHLKACISWACIS